MNTKQNAFNTRLNFGLKQIWMDCIPNKCENLLELGKIIGVDGAQQMNLEYSAL